MLRGEQCIEARTQCSVIAALAVELCTALGDGLSQRQTKQKFFAR